MFQRLGGWPTVASLCHAPDSREGFHMDRPSERPRRQASAQSFTTTLARSRACASSLRPRSLSPLPSMASQNSGTAHPAACGLRPKFSSSRTGGSTKDWSALSSQREMETPFWHLEVEADSFTAGESTCAATRREHSGRLRLLLQRQRSLQSHLEVSRLHTHLP